MRAKVKGPKHFETVTRSGVSRRLRRVARKSKEDRAAYQSADTMVEQAEALGGQGKYAAAEPLLREGARDPPSVAHRRPPGHR